MPLHVVLAFKWRTDKRNYRLEKLESLIRIYSLFPRFIGRRPLLKGTAPLDRRIAGS